MKVKYHFVEIHSESVQTDKAVLEQPAVISLEVEFTPGFYNLSVLVQEGAVGQSSFLMTFFWPWIRKVKVYTVHFTFTEILFDSVSIEKHQPYIGKFQLPYLFKHPDHHILIQLNPSVIYMRRSEERRVGKEWRSGGWRDR